jgi:hypothetical protein
LWHSNLQPDRYERSGWRDLVISSRINLLSHFRVFELKNRQAVCGAWIARALLNSFTTRAEACQSLMWMSGNSIEIAAAQFAKFSELLKCLHC